MSYNNLKREQGQKIVKMCDLHLNKCRFTTDESVANGTVTVNTAIPASGGIGLALTIAGGDITTFTASSFLAIDDEIIAVTIDSGVQVTITARAQFGTVEASHAASTVAEIKHSGEVDGTCFGLAGTCSDPNSFLDGLEQDFRFILGGSFPSERYLNGFQSWSHTPAKVDPGNSIGRRASASIRFVDSQDTGASGDKYYVPYADRWSNRGTLFGKLEARQVYFSSRRVTIWEGFADNTIDEADFISREYVIDTDGFSRDRNGNVTIKVLDPLIFTEDKKAKAPRESVGVLANDIDDL